MLHAIFVWRTTGEEHNPLKRGCGDNKAARNTGPLLPERVVNLPVLYLYRLERCCVGGGGRLFVVTDLVPAVISELSGFCCVAVHHAVPSLGLAWFRPSWNAS